MYVVSQGRVPDCCYVRLGMAPSIQTGDFSLRKTEVQSTDMSMARVLANSCFDMLGRVKSSNLMIKMSLYDTGLKEIDQSPCGGSCDFFRPFCRADGTCAEPTCQDLQPWCNNVTALGVRIRAYCPHTCGCNLPRSALSVSNGCGGFCHRSAEYVRHMKDTPCTDVDVADPVFQSFLANFRQQSADSFIQKYALNVGPQIEALSKYGCAFLNDPITMHQAHTDADVMAWSPFIYGNNPCAKAGWFPGSKPLSYWCPVACGCYRGDPYCFGTCPVRNESSPMCPKGQQSIEATGGILDVALGSSTPDEACATSLNTAPHINQFLT